MATSILAAGTDEDVSSTVTVGDSDTVLLSVYTSTGDDMPHGVVLSLQRADINGNFINVSTVGFGRVIFTVGCQQLVITSPGTYRVARPDITPWGTVGVGIQTGV